MKVTRFLAGLVLVGGMALSSDAFAQESVAPRLKAVLNPKLFSKFCGPALVRAAANYDKKQDDASLQALLNKMDDCEIKVIEPAYEAFAEIRDETDSEGGDDEGDLPEEFAKVGPKVSAFGFSPDLAAAEEEPMSTRD